MKKNEITIRSSAAEYLTFVASTGDSELQENSTIRKFRIVQNEGKRQVEREVSHY